MRRISFLIAIGIYANVLGASPADVTFIVDQSSSMQVRYAYVNPAKTDTLYYEDSTGCPPGNNYPGGTNTSGTLQVGSKFIPVLKSNTGCLLPSGDPFTIRESAVNQAAILISQVASTSTLSYLPFANTVLSGSQRPVSASPANVAAAGPFGLNGGKLVPLSAGGTNYNRPLDSAVRWLKNPALAPNTKHAIIFISDGRPSPLDSNGTRFIDSTIPVYGIYLGQLSTPDTASLKMLCDLTHGVFRRVSPGKPDSVISAVKAMATLIVGAPVSIGPKRAVTPKQSGVEDLRFFDLRGRTYSQHQWMTPSRPSRYNSFPLQQSTW